MGGAFKFGNEPPSEVPQPWKTFSDPISLKNPAAKKVPTTLVFFLEKNQKPESAEIEDENSEFRHKMWQRATGRGWSVAKFAGDHVAEKKRPLELGEFLDNLARR